MIGETIELDDLNDSIIEMDDIQLPESPLLTQAKENSGIELDAATRAAAAGSVTPSADTQPDSVDALTDEEVAGPLIETSVLGAALEDAKIMGITIPEKASKEEVSAYGDAYNYLLNEIDADRQYRNDETILRLAPDELIKKALRQSNPLLKKSDLQDRVLDYLELDEDGNPVVDNNGRPVLNEDGVEVYKSIIEPVKEKVQGHLDRFKKAFEEKYAQEVEARRSIITTARDFVLKDLPEVDGIKIDQLKMPKDLRLKLVNVVRDFDIQGKDANEKLSNAAFLLPETRNYIIQEVMKRAAEAATSKILKK